MIPRARPRAALAAAAILGGLAAIGLPGTGAAGLTAQTVAGRVTEQGTARPLPGAFIVLVDEDGRRRNGVLSAEDGRYALRAAAPGRYRLVAERIGYASTTTAWVDLPVGASVRVDIQIPVEAVSLDGIQVETGERCRRRPGSGPATARLWEEARKALEVARWSGAQDVLRFHVVQHRRELDARSLRVLSQSERGKSGYFDSSPYKSIPVERLARGYVQRSPGDRWDYFAPDADVLLSDSFLESHCFRVARSPRDEPDLIGLAFEPVPERRAADVSGVLWLDRGSAELRRLDFRYTLLPFRTGDWSQIGGRVEFERLATGMWIVRRWHIRMPLAARENARTRVLELVTLSEQGAEVRSVETRAGEPVAEAIGATLFGTVTAGEESSARALAGARVEVLPNDESSITAADGAFRITGLPSGTYTVRISHPELDASGIGALERTVALESGRATRLVAVAPLTAEDARQVCAADAWSGAAEVDPAVIYGTVSREESDPEVPGALVRVWVDGAEHRTVVDSAGAFRVCVRAGRAARIAAANRSVLGQEGLEVVEVEAMEPGFVRVTVPLSRPAPAAGVTAGRVGEPRGALVGRVLAAETDQPIAGAMVTLETREGVSVSRMSTGDDGRFRLHHPSRGERFTLRVELAGYATAQSEVRFAPGQELRVDVRIAREPVP